MIKTITTAVFSNNYVGIKLNSVSDIMKYNALHNQFLICNENEYYFDEYVEEYDGTGNITEREPTENEKLERILRAFSDGQNIYATFELDCGKVVPSNPTTLQSSFRVEQEVYFMHCNRMTKAKVAAICLISKAGKGNEVIQYPAIKISDSQEAICCRYSFALLIGNGMEYNVYLSDIFHTKEELANHLIDETCNE